MTNKRKTASNLTKLGLGIALAVLPSCSRNYSAKEKTIEDGTRVVIEEDKDHTIMRLLDGEEYVLIAEDGRGPAKKDGRFDTITLYHLPKGHRLEEYANVKKLNELYKKLK